MTSEFNPMGQHCVVFAESNQGNFENVLFQGEAVGFLEGHLGVKGNIEKDNCIMTIEWFPKSWIISGRIKFYYGLNNFHVKAKEASKSAADRWPDSDNLVQNSNQEVSLVESTINTADDLNYQKTFPEDDTETIDDQTIELADSQNDEGNDIRGKGEYRSSSRSSMLKVGEKIPEFQLYSTNGNLFNTSKIAKKTVLYFYPADGTESCTIEAKGFSAVYGSIKDMGLEVIGVSPDTIESHNKFRNDENIPFHLLFDDGSKVCEAFGLLQSPPPYEKYPVRITFLIDVDRKILGVWNDIDVSTHSEDVVSFVLEVLDKAG